MPTPQFHLVVHADWSVNPNKRWAARARWENGWTIEAIEQVGPVNNWVQGLCCEAARGSVLAGFDFPIGVPAAYGQKAGLGGFPDLLQAIGTGPWASFSDIARDPADISTQRPFYPAGASAGIKQADLLKAHGVLDLDGIRRACERKTADRRAACPVFWTLGGNQVGRGALSGWVEVLRPALRQGAKLWPFDGDLPALASGAGLVLAETYPAEAYGHVGVTFSQRESKTSQTDRSGKAGALLAWADRRAVRLSPSVEQMIQDGFGSDRAGEDRFDALLGLLGMIEVAAGWRSEGSGSDPVWEGWILGQGGSANPMRISADARTEVACMKVEAGIGRADEALRGYGLAPFATVRLDGDRFLIDITEAEIASREKSIYAFVIGDEIVRIGSSKAVLAGRMRSWQRDVSGALSGRKTSTPPWEAEAWRELLTTHPVGTVYARIGTVVETPVGTFSAYLDEESLLIGRYRPALNRSSHR